MHSPTLDTGYELDTDQIRRFRKNGHVYLAEVLSTEALAPYREAINRAADAHGISPDIPLEERDTYGKAFLQHMNLWVSDSTVQSFVMAKRFGKIAADLMGVDGVRLYHDQALFKEPGGGVTPWHQDQYYWPVDTDHTVTMWMPLVDLTEDMGILTFASCSHLNGYLGTLPISDESDQVFEKYVADQGMEICRRKTVRAGDATFHCGWNLHSAPANTGDQMREVMTVIWVADGCRVAQPINDNQRRDLARWMPGLKPGDVVESELNPLVYKRSPA